MLYLSLFLPGFAVIFALEHTLRCADTEETGNSSCFQVALLLFISNDQCCSELFSSPEKVGLSPSGKEEQNVLLLQC